MPGWTRAAAALVAPSAEYARLVWPLSMVQLVSWGTLYYGFAIFLTPMEAELGWARAELTGAVTLGMVVAGAASLPAGRLIDRGHGRLVMTAGSVLGGAMLFAWSRVTDVAAFYAIWFGIGLAMAGTLYEPAFAVLIRALADLAQRAVAAMTLVGGFASTVFIPICHLLIEHLGWRDALAVMGALNVVLGGVIHFAVLRDPTVRERVPGGSDASTAQILRAVFRKPAFWFLLAAVTGGFFSVAAVVFHIVPLMAERGFDTATAVAAIALIGPAQVAGRIMVVIVVPRLALPVSGMVAFGLPLLAMVLLRLGPAEWWVVATFAIALGAGNGIATIVRATSVARIVEAGAYGVVNGAINLPVSVARAFAPSVASVLWAAGGGYGPVLWILVGVSAVAVTCFLLGMRASAPTP
ncbi:MAG: MFS transporter [Hyphomicrobiales bacterium]|nr:MFS transporter [Hyphomicrobiales bacterium]MCP5374214.1 MFS transporter [Hyphomicrobiales bacterium]